MQLFIFSLESKVNSAAAAFAVGVGVDVAERIIFQLPGLAEFSVWVVLIAWRG